MEAAVPANVAGGVYQDIPEQAVKTRQELIQEKITQLFFTITAGFAATFVTALALAQTNFSVMLLDAMVASPAGCSLLITAIGITILASFCFSADESHKKTLFGLFSLFQGAFLSVLPLIDFPAFMMAGISTTALTGALSVISLNSKTDFDNLAPYLYLGLTCLCIMSWGSLLLPVVAANFFHEVSLFGGLALFTAFVLYDVQKAHKELKNYPDSFSPTHHAMDIYLDIINILIRLFELYARSQRNRN